MSELVKDEKFQKLLKVHNKVGLSDESVLSVVLWSCDILGYSGVLFSKVMH